MCKRIAAAVFAFVSFLFLAANYRTANFIVTAETAAQAKAIGDAAERIRRTQAKSWLGRVLPDLKSPCPINARLGDGLGAGGATSFQFEKGRPLGWTMQLQGPEREVLDSVLPHEVVHMIFAEQFGQPIPRWADEGAASCVESASSQAKNAHAATTLIREGRFIPLEKIVAMRDYPREVTPFFSQSQSLAQFLLARGGRRKFVEFVQTGLRNDDWSAAVHQTYEFKDLRELEESWKASAYMGVNPAKETE